MNRKQSIRSVIISWLNKSDSRYAVVRFCLITRMITARIGLQSVLLPLLITIYLFIFFIKPRVTSSYKTIGIIKRRFSWGTFVKILFFFSLIVALLWRVRAQMSRGSSLLFVIVLPFCAMNHNFFYYIAQVRPLGRIRTDW